MTRRKGELSGAAIDRGWPHQVALPADTVRLLFYAIEEYGKELTLCPRGHSVFDGNEWHRVYCFADAADAERFRRRFGGETFDPKERGRGGNWARWRRAGSGQARC